MGYLDEMFDRIRASVKLLRDQGVKDELVLIVPRYETNPSHYYDIEGISHVELDYTLENEFIVMQRDSYVRMIPAKIALERKYEEELKKRQNHT